MKILTGMLGLGLERESEGHTKLQLRQNDPYNDHPWKCKSDAILTQ